MDKETTVKAIQVLNDVIMVTTNHTVKAAAEKKILEFIEKL
jgi:hypothetical protein